MVTPRRCASTSAAPRSRPQCSMHGRPRADRDDSESPRPIRSGPNELGQHHRVDRRAARRHDRASVGFPGLVRDGRVVTAPFFIRTGGWGTAVSRTLRPRGSTWTYGRHRRATRSAVLVENDADVHGPGSSGDGPRVVITLGTGFGSGVFLDGAVCPHLELAHHPLSRRRKLQRAGGRRRPSPDARGGRWNDGCLRRSKRSPGSSSPTGSGSAAATPATSRGPSRRQHRS